MTQAEAGNLRAIVENTPPVSNREQLLKLIKRYPAERVKTDRDISIEGDPVHSLIHVDDGAVVLYQIDPNGHEINCGLLLPGDHFLPSLEGGLYRYYARALSGSVIRFIPLPDVQRVVTDSPALANALTEETLRIAERERKWIGRFKAGSLVSRVVSFILFFSEEQPTRRATKTPGEIVRTPFTQEELGAVIDASREKISKVLNQMRADGVIDYASQDGARKLTILDMSALQAYAIDEDEWQGTISDTE